MESTHSEPEALIAGLQRTDWKEAADDEPPMAWNHLVSLSRTLEDDDAVAARAVQILASVIGMMLRGSDWGSPYTPLMQLEGRRTHVPSDFDESELAFLRTLLPTLPPSQLSARIADLLHLRAHDKESRFSYAREAVERWIAAGPSVQLKRSETEDWQRAADIAARYKLHDEKEKLIGLALTVVRSAEAWGALNMARAMRRARYFAEPKEVSQRLEALAEDVDERHFRRELLDEAAKWVVADDDARRAGLRTRIGDLWWDEALERRADSHMVARDFLGNAHAAYRAVPSKHRSEQTLQRLQQLPGLIREEGELSLDEMSSFEVEGIDVSPIVERAEAIAQMDDVLDALATWFSEGSLERFEASRKQAEENMREHPIVHLFNRTTVASDGRKVHSSGSAKQRMGVPSDVWAEMVRSHQMHASLLAAGHVWPALRIFSTRQRFSLTDFEMMASASPFIPVPVRGQYAKGLYHGYYGRLAEAVHLLAPATEACVRSILQGAGIETRNIKTDDTEIEPGLSALMELDRVEEILTPDLAWNIRAIYCDPVGPNIRNRVAHGLLSSDEADGLDMLSPWWLAFRLAFVPFYNAVRREPKDDTGTETEAGEESSESP